MKIFNFRQGFTVVEMILVMFIFVILYSIVSLRLVNITQIASVRNPLESFITDMKSQQSKAMVGDTQGSADISDYGIYFESGRYILFRGSAYSGTEATNYIVNLNSPVQFSTITFPNAALIFSRGSGEVAGFVNGQNTVTIRNQTSGEQKTVTVNRYGVITSVN